jgi:shikimate dehydrogenase
MTAINLNPQTRFILSTSGSASSLEKHNSALQASGINLGYFTFSYPINAEMYASVLRSPLVRGGAVTGQGLKSDIIEHLDELDELAKTTGAVNTVVNDAGKLHGYNTDAFGFETALHENLKTKVKSAVIYGNGGVSGVAAHVLRKMGVRTTMTGRNADRVANKMSALQLEQFDGPYDLVVSATPVSSESLEQAAGLLEILEGAQVVFDHNMPEADGGPNYLQKYCANRSIGFIAGHEMYVPQMLKQWRLFLDGYTEAKQERHASVTEDDIKKYWDL